MHIHNLRDNTALSINARKNYIFAIGEKSPRGETKISPNAKNRRDLLDPRKAAHIQNAQIGNIAQWTPVSGQYTRKKYHCCRFSRVLSSLSHHVYVTTNYNRAQRGYGHRRKAHRSNVMILSGDAEQLLALVPCCNLPLQFPLHI